ncbi:unnamed protein product [Eretmochelys imbricata]
MLPLLQGALSIPAAPSQGWLQKLGQDCMEFLQISISGGPTYSSLHSILYTTLHSNGIPPVCKECRVPNRPKEAVFLCLATELCQTLPDCARLTSCELPTIPHITVEVNGINPGERSSPFTTTHRWYPL